MARLAKTKDWQTIRVNRPDLTDYVIHFTNPRFGDECGGYVSARNVLLEILDAGFIRAAFGARRNRSCAIVRPTVKGPSPAVCLTEQPLWAVLKTRAAATITRYSGYGIAYCKYLLYFAGGRPVLYGSSREIGRRLQKGEDGWEDGKDIFVDGLPKQLQYLWVNYEPGVADLREPPVDFTWEREWRVRPDSRGLPIYLKHSFPNVVAGAIIVETDSDVQVIRDRLQLLTDSGKDWPAKLTRIISLETAERRVKEGRHGGFIQVDTWEDE